MKVMKNYNNNNFGFIDKLKSIFSKFDLWYGSRFRKVTYVSSKREMRVTWGYALLVFGLFWFLQLLKSNYGLWHIFSNIPIFKYIFYWQIRYSFLSDVLFLFLVYLFLKRIYNRVAFKFRLPVLYGCRIKNSLIHVIRSNHLYNSVMVDGVENVTSSVVIWFAYTSDLLCLKVYSNGANYTLKSQDLSIVFQSALGLRCLEVDNSVPNYTKYTFRRSQVERVYVDDDSVTEIYGSDYEIRLDGETMWNYTKAPHALIAGGTGGGKSTYINYLILELLKNKAEIYLCDPKRSDLYSFKEYLPEGRVASSPNQIAKIMRETVELMNKRYEENTGIFQGNFADYGLRPRFVFFDEIGAFMEEDKKIAKEVSGYMKQIIFKGRQMGVFMVLSTQKPNAEAIPTAVRDQIGLRVTLGQMSNSGLKMALGDFEEDLPQAEIGQGKGYYYVDGLGWSAPRPYTAPYLNSKEIDYISALKQAVAFSEGTISHVAEF